MTAPDIPDGLADRLEDWRFNPNDDDRADAADVVRYWQRVSRHIPTDTLALAEACADIADVLPDGWTVKIATHRPNVVSIFGADELRVLELCYVPRRKAWSSTFDRNDYPTARDAALAALAALGVTPA